MKDAEEKEVLKLSDKAKDALAKLVLDRFDAARAARAQPHYKNQSIDNWLEEGIKRYQAQHDNDKFNLTRIKTRGINAKVRDMVINSVDAPFTITPTPIPTLSKAQEEKVLSNVERALGEKLIENGIVIRDAYGNVFPDYDAIKEPDGVRLVPSVREWLHGILREQKLSMQAQATKIATQAADHAAKLMQDQLLEGGWREAFLDACFDIFLYGTGCIRQEIRERENLKWSGDTLVPTTSKDITWRHVPIGSCFPSADSESAAEGTYFIECSAMRKQDLFAAVQIDWVDKKRVREAYAKASRDFNWLNLDNEMRQTNWDDDALIDVLVHEGAVKGDVLLEYLEAVDDKRGIEEHQFYTVEAIVLAGVTIGMRVLTYPNDGRSYFSANFERVGRKFWGIGAAMALSTIEDRINGYLEDLRDNLSLSVAPPIFYNVASFENPEDVTLDKRRKIPFNPDPTGGGAPPFYQPQFDSKSGELINLFNVMYRLADDESGIPGMLNGNDQLAGGESTFRGMKLLAATANALIKASFLNIDKTMIQPAMEYLWRWNMLNNDDDAIKADVRIVARGTSGLMQQEIAAAERMDAMPVVMQLIQAAGLAPAQQQAVVQYLLRSVMEQGGIPVDELIDDPQVKAEQASTTQMLDANPQAPQPSLQPATPLPTIGADKNTGGLSAT